MTETTPAPMAESQQLAARYTAAQVLARQRRRELVRGLCKKAVCIAMVCVTLIPFYISFIYSIKYKNEITVSHLAWPQHPTLSNYVRVITENEQFLVGIKNSVLTTIPTILLLLVIAALLHIIHFILSIALSHFAVLSSIETDALSYCFP